MATEFLTGTDTLVRELCRVNHIDDVRKHRAKLDWMALQRDQELLAALLAYVDEYDTTPTPLAALKQYVATKPLNTGMMDEVDALLQYPAEEQDLNQLINNCHKDVRKKFMVNALEAASMFIVNGATKKGQKIPNSDTPEWVMNWLQHAMKRDWKDDDQGAWLHESDGVIKEELSKDHTKDRITTGFRSIDRNIILSRKVNPFWVIPGFAHEGKSTVLTSLMYEFVTQPLRIAYFSKEHEVTELLQRMAFLHAYRFKRDLSWVLPSMNDWYTGKRTAEDEARMDEIVADILKLPGKIKFFPLKSWAELTAALQQDTFDVCAVDYLAIMDTPGVDDRYKREEIRKLVGNAANLSRTYNNGAGLVFVTPAQINREGKKGSLKKEGTEKKYDLTAIAQYSELYQDAYFVFSLFSDDDMKAHNQWLLEVHKVRMLAPQWYPTAVLTKDYSTGHVRETPGIMGDAFTSRSPLHAWTDDSVKADTYSFAEEL